MNLNKIELKKILYSFNSISNRLLKSDLNDYNANIIKYKNFLDDTEIISKYITSCGKAEQDMEEKFKEVSSGEFIFSLGMTAEEEVKNIYAIISHICYSNVDVSRTIGYAYSGGSRKFADSLNGFNLRVISIFINHIEIFLTNLGIEMGIDDKVQYQIKVNNGQVNIASDSSIINAESTVNYQNLENLKILIKMIEELTDSLSPDDKEVVEDSLDVFVNEFSKQSPKKSYIRTAITALTAIKGSVEFGAAAAALIQFVQTLY